MKYANRNSIMNKLALGMLVAMGADATGSNGSALLTFEDLKDLSIDDIMDMPLGEIADAAGFLVPPAGQYHLELSIDFGTQGTGDKEQKCIAATWTILSTIELVDEENEVRAADGAEFTTNWVGGGVQFFKTALGPTVLALGGTEATTLSESLGILNGAQVSATITHRLDKEKKDDKGQPRKYPQVGNIQLLNAPGTATTA